MTGRRIPQSQLPETVIFAVWKWLHLYEGVFRRGRYIRAPIVGSGSQRERNEDSRRDDRRADHDGLGAVRGEVREACKPLGHHTAREKLRRTFLSTHGSDPSPPLISFPFSSLLFPSLPFSLPSLCVAPPQMLRAWEHPLTSNRSRGGMSKRHPFVLRRAANGRRPPIQCKFRKIHHIISYHVS